MNDFKKKIIDIIFEPDTEDIKAEAPLTDVNDFKKESKSEETYEPVKLPTAKDILYSKSEKNSPFIDYTEVPRKEEPKKEENNQENYEMRENVSPIFGLISQKERKKKTATEKEIQKAISNNYRGEYTGVVLSPIYGYDVNKANDARKSLTNVLDTSKVTLDFMDEEEAFEIPEDMKETIKEAVEEAVIELTPKNSILEEEAQTNNVSEDVYQNEVEDLECDTYQEVEETQEIEEIEDELVEPVKEETTEIEIPVFKNNTTKATRSIYDTAPVQLFDFDELSGSGGEKDLFDELIGDGD